MERYSKFMFEFEAENGVTFEVKEKENGNLLIRATREHELWQMPEREDYKYENPPIPEGYVHITGHWYNGFVIERKSDGSQFVWIPVGYLNANGILDGLTGTYKFGRRNFLGLIDTFKEAFEGEIVLQFESVKKYGGFYISRYNISKNEETGKPQSVKGAKPCIDISYENAKKVAASIEENDAVTSHLTFGAEYDSVLEWILESEVKNEKEVTSDSTEWGNYSIHLENTGSSELWCVNNIYDLAGNVSEFTQEQYKNDEGECYPVYHGGFLAFYEPVAYMDFIPWGIGEVENDAKEFYNSGAALLTREAYLPIGFRAVLTLK